MAYVVKRRLKRGGHSYLVRYYGPDGRVHSRQFAKKGDADRFAHSMEVTKSDGSWIDPARGRLTLGEWVERWKPTQVQLRASTRARDESYLNTHVLPRFGDRPLVKIEHAEIRAWVADLAASGRAPATVGKAHQILSKVLRRSRTDATPTNWLVWSPRAGEIYFAPVDQLERTRQRNRKFLPNLNGAADYQELFDNTMAQYEAATKPPPPAPPVPAPPVVVV